MYGSIFRMRPKKGKRDALYQEMDRWVRERAPNVNGYISSYMLETAGGDVLGVAMFEDEKAYRDNANDPEQNRWYKQIRSHLQADPEWNDGVIRRWVAHGSVTSVVTNQTIETGHVNASA
jgi:hypothetical protein